MKSAEQVLEKAVSGKEPLDDGEIEYLLRTPAGKPAELLFSAARQRRSQVFGDQIFLYGFVYFSTYCRNRCRFCLYRQANSMAPRYRKEITAVQDAAKALEDSGVHLIDLTMGEDPYYLEQDGENLLELVLKCRQSVALPIMLSPGVLPSRLLHETARVGVDWYACYQETFSRDLFSRLRTDQSFSARCDAKTEAGKAGLLIEEGLLLGVGERPQETAMAFKEMDRLGASQVRAMTFRPQAGTPMADFQAKESLDELRTIAALRLCFPEKLIPASLDVDGLQGLRNRLLAGANVITSLIPASHSLAGVSSARSGVENGQRSVKAVTPVIEDTGLRISPISGYRMWIDDEKRRVGRQDRVDSKSMKPGWTPEPSANFR